MGAKRANRDDLGLTAAAQAVALALRIPKTMKGALAHSRGRTPVIRARG